MKQINHLSSPHPPPSPSQRENKQSLTFSSANKVCFAREAHILIWDPQTGVERGMSGVP